MSDAYQLFGDDAIDTIRERALQLHLAIPSSFAEYLENAKIKEIVNVPEISQCIPLVLKDLNFICGLLQIGVEACEKEMDIVTQNILSDFQKDIGIAKRKLESLTA